MRAERRGGWWECWTAKPNLYSCAMHDLRSDLATVSYKLPQDVALICSLSLSEDK